MGKLTVTKRLEIEGQMAACRTAQGDPEVRLTIRRDLDDDLPEIHDFTGHRVRVTIEVVD